MVDRVAKPSLLSPNAGAPAPAPAPAPADGVSWAVAPTRAVHLPQATVNAALIGQTPIASAATKEFIRALARQTARRLAAEAFAGI